MATSEDLLIKISIDTSKASSGISDIKSSLDGVKSSSDKTSKATEALSERFGGLSGAVIIANQALALAKTAFGALEGIVGSSTKAYFEQEKASIKLAAALAGVGQLTDKTVKSFEEFAAQMQNSSAVGDEVILDMVAMAKNMGLTDEMTKKLIKSSVGLAAATGKDVSSAFQELAGQFNGVAGRSAKLVSGLGDLTEAELRAGKGIELVAAQYEKFTNLASKTASGALEIMKLAFGEVLESLGNLFVEIAGSPALMKVLTESFLSLAKSIQGTIPDLISFRNELTNTFSEVSKALKDIDWDVIAKGVRNLTIAILTLTLAFKGLAIVESLAATFAVLLMTIQTLGPVLLAAAAALASTAATAALVIAAFAILGVGIDLVIANFKHLGDIGSLALLKIKEQALETKITLASVFGIGDTKAYEERLAKVRSEIKELSAATPISKGTIIPAIDEAIKGIKNVDKALTTSSKTMDAVTAGAKNFGLENEKNVKKTEAVTAALKKQMETVTALIGEARKENAKLLSDTLTIGQSRITQLGMESTAQLEALRIKNKQIVLDQQKLLMAEGNTAKSRELLAILSQTLLVDQLSAAAAMQLAKIRAQSAEDLKRIAEQIEAVVIETKGVEIQILELQDQKVEALREQNKLDLRKMDTRIAEVKLLQSSAQAEAAMGTLARAALANHLATAKLKKEEVTALSGQLDILAEMDRAKKSEIISQAVLINSMETLRAKTEELGALKLELIDPLTISKAFALMLKGIQELWAKAKTGSEPFFADVKAGAQEAFKGVDVREAFNVNKLKYDFMALQALWGAVFAGDKGASAGEALRESIVLAGESFYAVVKGAFEHPKESIAAIGSTLKVTGKYLYNGATDLVKAVGDIKLADVGAALQGAFTGIVAAFSPSNINSLSDTFSSIRDLPQQMLTAFSKLGTVIQTVIEKLPEAAKKLFEMLPTLIQGILNALPQLIAVLMEALGGFIEMLPEIFGRIMDALPGIITAFLSRLPEIIKSLFAAFSEIIAELMAALPDIIVSIMESLPEIITSVIEGLIGSLGDMVTILIDFLFAGGAEKIIKSLIKSIPKIIIAILKGVLNGVSKALGSIFGGIDFGGQDEAENISDSFIEGVKKMGKAGAKEASQLFKVLALDNLKKTMRSVVGAVGEKDTGAGNRSKKHVAGLLEIIDKAIRNLINMIVKGLFEPLAALLRGILDPIFSALMSFVLALRGAWDWVREQVLNPMRDMIWDAWRGIIQFLGSDWPKQIWQLFVDIAQTIWAAIEAIPEFIASALLEIVTVVGRFFNDIFGPFLAGLAAGFTELAGALGSVLQGFVDGVLTPLLTIGDQLWTAFKSGIENAGNFFADIGTSIWNGLKDGLAGIGKIITDALNAINPGNLFSKIFAIPASETAAGKGGTVEKALGINVPFVQFAQGGMVPGNALTSGDSLLNDRILALLSPGEVVIPRSKMANPEIAAIVQSVLGGELNLPRFAIGGAVGSLVSGGKKIISGAASTVKSATQTLSGVSQSTLNSVNTSVQKALASGDTLLKRLDPNQLWKLAKEEAFSSIMKMFEHNKFHGGGLVPSFAGGGEVPSTLLGGEFVMNRGATRSLGVGNLSRMNATGADGISPVVNMDITVNIEASAQSLDSSFIRNRLIPDIKKELKESSVRGEFLMSRRGLRE